MCIFVATLAVVAFYPSYLPRPTTEPTTARGLHGIGGESLRKGGHVRVDGKFERHIHFESCIPFTTSSPLFFAKKRGVSAACQSTCMHGVLGAASAKEPGEFLESQHAERGGPSGTVGGKDGSS